VFYGLSDLYYKPSREMEGKGERKTLRSVRLRPEAGLSAHLETIFRPSWCAHPKHSPLFKGVIAGSVGWGRNTNNVGRRTCRGERNALSKDKSFADLSKSLKGARVRVDGY